MELIAAQLNFSTVVEYHLQMNPLIPPPTCVSVTPQSSKRSPSISFSLVSREQLNLQYKHISLKLKNIKFSTKKIDIIGEKIILIRYYLNVNLDDVLH